MGTGVTSSLLSPHFLLVFSSCCCVAAYSIVSHILKYAPSSLARAPCIRIKIHRNSFWVCSIAPSKLNNICLKLPSSFALPWNLWSSFRPISIGQLHTLLHFHLRPINVIVSHGSYLSGGDLVLWGASYLDAFSTYPFHTWLPSYALGRTTGAPEVCPSRSSRTKNSSTQISNAHSG